MKKFIFFIMLLLVSNAHAEAQRRKPVLCYELKELVERVVREYGEKLNFTYADNFYQFNTSVSMFINKEKGTWTLIEHDENLACVLASGKSEDL